MSHAILLISCPDQKGITATVTDFVFQNNGNIIHADQHIDDQGNVFFMRIEWSMKGFRFKKNDITKRFAPIAKKFRMKLQLYFSDDIPLAAIFVSKPLHCLYDLLWRYREGQLLCRIPLIISNHSHAGPIAADFGIKFYQFPITKRNKKAQEKRELELLRRERIETIVLARYHQILSPQFVKVYENKIINIHHSFLPAFAGKNPYQQAHHKGVKIVGATAHYVTERLDEGPIIEQDITRISHRDSLENIVRKGQDLEKAVLNRAVRWHLERKILTFNRKTVIFD